MPVLLRLFSTTRGVFTNPLTRRAHTNLPNRVDNSVDEVITIVLHHSYHHHCDYHHRYRHHHHYHHHYQQHHEKYNFMHVNGINRTTLPFFQRWLSKSYTLILDSMPDLFSLYGMWVPVHGASVSIVFVNVSMTSMTSMTLSTTVVLASL